MHGRLTCLACAGNLASSQVGLATRKKSSSRPGSWKYLQGVGGGGATAGQQRVSELWLVRAGHVAVCTVYKDHGQGWQECSAMHAHCLTALQPPRTAALAETRRHTD
jgi:hypothetical protein